MYEIDIHLKGFNKIFPVTEGDILEFTKQSNISLPTDYLNFLKTSDGGEGFVGEAYISLWRLSELLPLNKDYQVQLCAPGLLVFGSDGGGEAFGFDTRSDWKVVRIPFIGMNWSVAEVIGSSFCDMLSRLSSRSSGTA